ncbi:major coat protein [Alteromonas phage vB_AmeP_PT11-V19]|nr:major coat protein [Alteromonas phage vB_AmeP_PT11-V19]
MADNIYNRSNGNSSHGQNTIVHYYDKAGVKAANAIAVYAQFSDRRSMPLKMGMTYKTSKWLHIADRETGTDAFKKKGYLTARSIVDISNGLASDVSLPEGAGPQNKQSIKKVTIETKFARYGEMIDYTDEVEMFSEDMVQVRYREELGLLANRRAEDLVQLDMLSTTTNMFSGTANSMEEVGVDVVATDGADDEHSKVSYDLIRKAVRRLVRNRAQKNTEIVTGSTKIGTTPINKAFYAIIGPEIKYDLENLTRGGSYEKEFVYMPAYKYAAASNLAEGEVGSMGDVRFIESESQLVYEGAGAVVPAGYAGGLATTTHADGSDVALNSFLNTDKYSDGETRFNVYPILFPTKGSFATVGLKGHGKIKFNSKAPSDIERSNPYGTHGFFSYNMWYAGIILREERLLKALVAASE